MPLQIIRADLTRIACDAVVNPTDERLSGSGGLDAQLHRAAGAGLDKACARIGACAAGEAVLTKGYDLPAKYVIHTVGPIWTGDNVNEKNKLLANCYINSLSLAKKYHLPKEVVTAIAHHHDQIFPNPYVIITKIADTISAGRKGARTISEIGFKQAKIAESICKKNIFVRGVYTISGTNFLKIIIIPKQNPMLKRLPLEQAILRLPGQLGIVPMVIPKEWEQAAEPAVPD